MAVRMLIHFKQCLLPYKVATTAYRFFTASKEDPQQTPSSSLHADEEYPQAVSGRQSERESASLRRRKREGQ
jgi:hypothetical protein